MKKKILIVVAFIVVVIIALFFSLDTYTACGCGGCGGVDPIIEFTTNPKEKILNDQRIQGKPICNAMGCSICRRYIFFRFSNQ
jgi:uncharacterized protein YxeA